MRIQVSAGRHNGDCRDRAQWLKLTADTPRDRLKIAFLYECEITGNYKDMNRRFRKFCKEVEKREAERK